MNSEMIHFFDRAAPQWDHHVIRDERVITKILDCAQVKPGARVLDVACGTGVLFPDYLDREVSVLTGVDVSPGMLRVAQEKTQDKRVRLVCSDICTVELEETYDCCVVYNAFPHFPKPTALLENVARFVRPGGVLTIAHGMSRRQVNRCHENKPHAISTRLPEAEELCSLLPPYFAPLEVVSDDAMYLVTGVRLEQ